MHKVLLVLLRERLICFGIIIRQTDVLSLLFLVYTFAGHFNFYFPLSHIHYYLKQGEMVCRVVLNF